MGIFTGMSELELVENYLYELHRPTDTVYTDEQALSDAFDNMVRELDTDSDTLKDRPAMAEWFNNWTDQECKEGNLHSSQYSDYTYVGKYDI